MRANIPLNNDWQFVFTCTDEFLRGEVPGEVVRLPHTVKLLPCRSFKLRRPSQLPQPSLPRMGQQRYSIRGSRP